MPSIPDENVPHEDAHAKATDAHMRRTSDVGVIPQLPAPSATYVQMEMGQVVWTVNQILTVLIEAELIPD